MHFCVLKEKLSSIYCVLKKKTLIFFFKVSPFIPRLAQLLSCLSLLPISAIINNMKNLAHLQRRKKQGETTLHLHPPCYHCYGSTENHEVCTGEPLTQQKKCKQSVTYMLAGYARTENAFPTSGPESRQSGME